MSDINEESVNSTLQGEHKPKYIEDMYEQDMKRAESELGPLQEPCKTNLVLYHGNNCPDGFAAATVLYMALGDTADYIAINYGDGLPDVRGKEVYLVDFAFVNEQLHLMHDLNNKAKNWVLIDHHATAIKQLQSELSPEMLSHCVFDTTRCGAMLTWRTVFPKTEPPLFLHYIQDADLYQNKLQGSKEVTTALVHWLNFDFNGWVALMRYSNDSSFNNLKWAGDIIITALKKQFEQALAAQHPIWLMNHSGLAVNADVLTFKTELGNALAQKSMTFGCVYQQIGNKWKLSLRSLNDLQDTKGQPAISCNVKKIAESFGGGGHDTAASFYLTNEQMGELLATNYGVTE